MEKQLLDRGAGGVAAAPREQLLDGGAGRLRQGFRAGRPLVTLILMAGMYVLPSAAAEVAMESNFEEMDGAGQAFSGAQQGEKDRP